MIDQFLLSEFFRREPIEYWQDHTGHRILVLLTVKGWIARHCTNHKELRETKRFSTIGYKPLVTVLRELGYKPERNGER